jgi:hypothetical protein
MKYIKSKSKILENRALTSSLIFADINIMIKNGFFKKLIGFICFILVFCSCSSIAHAEDLFFIDKGETIYLQSENNARTTDGWFVTQNGMRVKIAEGIIVELKNEADAKTVFSIPDVKSYEKLVGNIFLVIPADKNRQFELSREFLNNNLVKNSHPNLIRERKLR